MPLFNGFPIYLQISLVMTMDQKTYNYGDYIQKKGDKLDKTMIVMHGECNTILEGIFPKEINTRPSKSKDYDVTFFEFIKKSMNVGCNSPRAHIKQMAQPSDMNFSNQVFVFGLKDLDCFRKSGGW